MGEFKGTPGPWLKDVRTSKKDITRIVAIIPKRYGERVLETELVTGYIYDDDCGVETCCKVEEHSNARLIAAAPEMLDALQKVYGLIKQCGIEEDMDIEEVDYIGNAINKALGEVKP